MKQFLLSGLLSVASLSMMAAVPAVDLHAVDASALMQGPRAKSATSKSTAQIIRRAPGMTMTVSNGMKKLHILNDANGRIKVPQRRAAASRADGQTMPDGFVMYESFEGWDGETKDWTPEGWTVDMRGEVERDLSWTPEEGDGMTLPAAADGKYYYAINYSDEAKQDEWLISPEVEVQEGMRLSYALYLEPVYMFNVDEDGVVDWDTGDFLKEPTVICDFQVWAQPEDGEWTMIHDYADDYIGMSLYELYYAAPYGLESKSHGLEEFEGKKIRVAFRYVGHGGNTTMIDAIGVGYPQYEGITYLDPMCTLYWGWDRDFFSITSDIAHYPVYAPLTWQNMDWGEGVTYTWNYNDPVTGEWVEDTEHPDELTLTYVPDYTNAETMRNNFNYPPVLTASSKFAPPASYNNPYLYFQAGGKPERTITYNGEPIQFEPTLLPFGKNTLGYTWTTVDDPVIGDLAIPVFGYNPNVNTYWLNYSLNGEEALEGDFARLEGIANLFFPSEAPLVVNGVTAFAYGQIGPDVQLTASIIALNEFMDKDMSTWTTVASATIKGSQVITDDPNGHEYLALPFDFDEPVVISATAEHPAYFIMIQGFNNEDVDMFAPLQSYKDADVPMTLGYQLMHVNLSKHTGQPEYYNIKCMVYKEDGEYVDPYGSFAIGLDAEYPWLTTEVESLTLGATDSKVTAALGSYYDGSKLTVEAPAGLSATVKGRYNECVLTVTRAAGSTGAAEGNVVVKGPGVELTIPVTSDEAGIMSVVAGTEDAAVTETYDLSGRKVASQTARGIYLNRHADGSVSKVIVK